MKKQYLIGLFTLTFALGLSARAQGEDNVIAKVPYDFVAGGALLPAGTYKVSRVNAEGPRELVISSYETGAGALLIPTVFEDAPSEHPQLRLQSVGNKYFLSKIQTSNGVYSIAIPRSATTLAQMKQHQGPSAAGSN